MIERQEQHEYLSSVREKLSEAKQQLCAIAADNTKEATRKEIANRLELQRRFLLMQFAQLQGGNAPQWETARTIFDLTFTDFMHQLDKQFRAANSELFEGNEQLPSAHSAGNRP